MRDFTLHFNDKADFRASLRKLNQEKDKELQNAVLVDEIGFIFRETDVSDNGELECTRDEGYFVNIRLLDDGFDDSVFREWVVTPERLLREWFQGQQVDITPILHAICTVAVQGLVGCTTGDQACDAAIACMFFVAREHTQAEYRWIERFGDSHRHKVPWWGGFDSYVWDVASLMDFVVPVVACAGLHGYMLIFSRKKRNARAPQPEEVA